MHLYIWLSYSNCLFFFDNTFPLTIRLFFSFISYSIPSRVNAALFGSQFMQFTVMTMIAGIFCFALEKGVYESIKTHLSIIGRGGLMFFSFILGTKATSMQNKLLYGEGGYLGTGRGLGLQHIPFNELFRSYGANQTLLGFEIAFALVIYRYLSGIHLDENRSQLIETFPLVLISVSFIYTPFIMNPSALNCDVIRHDWEEFLDWVQTSGGSDKQSWETWYTQVVKLNAQLPLGKRTIYIFIPSLRKLGLWFCCAHLVYESSEETDLPINSSLVAMGLTVLIFVFLLFLDAFLLRAANFTRVKALEDYKEEDTTTTDMQVSSSSSSSRGGGGKAPQYSRIEVEDDSENGGDNQMPQPNSGATDDSIWDRLEHACLRSARISVWLIVSVAVVSILLFMVARFLTVGCVWWTFQCLITLMYWVLHDLVLVYINCGSDQVRKVGHIPGIHLIRGAFIRQFMQVIHIAMGAVIMIPLYCLSQLPFMNTLHNQLLFNDTFAAKADANYHSRRITTIRGQQI